MSRELRRRAKQLLHEGSRPEIVDGTATGSRVVSESSWQSAVTLAESCLSDLRFHPRSAWKPSNGSVLWWILDPEFGPQAETIGPESVAHADYLWWTPISTPSDGRSDELPALV